MVLMLAAVRLILYSVTLLTAEANSREGERNDMIGHDATGMLRQEGAAFKQLVSLEIQSARAQQKTLLLQGKTGYATILILFFCIAINIGVFFAIPDYKALFIAASIYLQMFYFITLLIPMGGEGSTFPKKEVLKSFSTLFRKSFITTTDRFTRIFMDVFFMNSRTLAAGFLCILSVDILFTLLGYFTGEFSRWTAAVILFQVVVIAAFYFLLMRLEPGTARFRARVIGMKGSLAARYPSWVIAVLFGAAALLVLLLILSTIILLPGMTVKAFMSLSGLEEVTNLILLLALIAASQYFIVRFFHGIASTRMAGSFAETRILLLEKAGNEAPSGTDSEDPAQSAAESLLESKIYRLGTRSIVGLFPVYIVDLDFSVLFDEKVITVITGYLKGAGQPGRNSE
jgi:hypothetical protein